MRSKYAIRLYELLRSYDWQRNTEHYRENEARFTVDDFRKRIDAEKYERYTNLKQKVIKPAIDEINAISREIHVTLEEITIGNKVKDLIFITEFPNGVQRAQATLNRRERESKG